MHAYRHGVIDQRLPTSGEPLPPDWALQDPDDYVESLGAAVRGAVADVGRRRRRGRSASAPTSPRARWCRRSPTARRCAHLAEFKDRPHAFVKLWRHHAAQPQADRINAVAAGRGEPWLAALRRADLVGVGVRQGARAARRRSRGVPGDGAVGRGRRLDRVAAVRASTCATPARAGYKGILQDGRYPSREFLAELDPAFADFVDDQARPADRPARRARRHAHRGDGRADSACPRASPSPSATSTPT